MNPSYPTLLSAVDVVLRAVLLNQQSTAQTTAIGASYTDPNDPDSVTNNIRN
jgi:hypothetical protein